MEVTREDSAGGEGRGGGVGGGRGTHPSALPRTRAVRGRWGLSSSLEPLIQSGREIRQTCAVTTIAHARRAMAAQ
jgi:hypothetical protein